VDEEFFGTVGRFLAELSTMSAGELEPFGLREELAVLDHLHERVVAVRAEPEGWSATRQALATVLLDAPTVDLLPAHRDLHDGQLFSHERRVALLDFDLACLAEPALDLANLSAHMQLRVLQNIGGASQRGADLCARALVEGRGLPGGPQFLERLRLYQASTFLRLALLNSIRPRWVQLTPTLIAFARRSLEDVVRVA
jgi:aminoglycoside phosphotransferase (APT) family kinase protein